MSLAVTRDPYKRGIASVRKTALAEKWTAGDGRHRALVSLLLFSTTKTSVCLPETPNFECGLQIR